MPLLRLSPLLVWFRRVLASGAAALVFGLGVAAMNPSLHARLHETGSHRGGHEHPAPAESCGSLCAILLVAAGIEPAVEVALPVPAGRDEVAAWAMPSRPDLAAPRFLRPPERGPPQG